MLAENLRAASASYDLVAEKKLGAKQGMAQEWTEYLKAMWAQFREGRLTSREVLKMCVAKWPKRKADVKLENETQDDVPAEEPLEYEPPAEEELSGETKKDFLATVMGWSQ